MRLCILILLSYHLRLRDEVRNLQCSYKCRHDAAADLIHLYAYTKCFFRKQASHVLLVLSVEFYLFFCSPFCASVWGLQCCGTCILSLWAILIDFLIFQEYKSVTSPPVYITPLDLGPKYTDKLGSDRHEYCKTYGEHYCLGQLMFWHNQNAEPDCSLAEASRGCLSLPDISSFYAKINKPSRQRIYGPRTLKHMLARMVSKIVYLFHYIGYEMNKLYCSIIQTYMHVGSLWLLVISRQLKC